MGSESVAHEANQKVLAMFGRCEQYSINSVVNLIGNKADRRYIWLETRQLGKNWTKVMAFTAILLRRNRSNFWLKLNGRNAQKHTAQWIFFYFLRSISVQDKTSVYIPKPFRKIGQTFGESLRGDKHVMNLEIFWMNNKTINVFDCRSMWRMENGGGGGCSQPQPSASVNNIPLDLHNSSHPSQSHSIIVKYTMRNIE